MIRLECDFCNAISPAFEIEDNPGDGWKEILAHLYQEGWVEWNRDSNGPKVACGNCEKLLNTPGLKHRGRAITQIEARNDELRPPPKCCGGGPQWGHAWDCETLP
jgi:hypothetical protein